MSMTTIGALLQYFIGMPIWFLWCLPSFDLWLQLWRPASRGNYASYYEMEWEEVARKHECTAAWFRHIHEGMPRKRVFEKKEEDTPINEHWVSLCLQKWAPAFEAEKIAKNF